MDEAWVRTRLPAVLQNISDRIIDSVNLVNEATEEDRKAQKARAGRYGIGVKKVGHITKPKAYSNVPTSQFADPVNFKYPIDKPHVLPAIRYFNQTEHRIQGGYNSAEWAKMGSRIASAAGKKYQYKSGKVTRKNK